VEVSGVGLTQIPIAVAAMRGEEIRPKKYRPSSKLTWSAAANFVATP
jgi:hypothetical protein